MGEKGQCLSCGAESKDRPLVKCEVNGEDKNVCVKCLPMLIHG